MSGREGLLVAEIRRPYANRTARSGCPPSHSSVRERAAVVVGFAGIQDFPVLVPAGMHAFREESGTASQRESVATVRIFPSVREIGRAVRGRDSSVGQPAARRDPRDLLSADFRGSVHVERGGGRGRSNSHVSAYRRDGCRSRVEFENGIHDAVPRCRRKLVGRRFEVGRRKARRERGVRKRNAEDSHGESGSTDRFFQNFTSERHDVKKRDTREGYPVFREMEWLRFHPVTYGDFGVADDLFAELVALFEFDHDGPFRSRDLRDGFVERRIERLSDRFER